MEILKVYIFGYNLYIIFEKKLFFDKNGYFFKKQENFNEKQCHPFVWDITDEKAVANANFPIPKNSLDCVIMVFVLSAISPEKLVKFYIFYVSKNGFQFFLRMSVTIRNLTSLLKPGGRLLFRDYGKYDLAQLRFKKGR